MTNTTGSSGSGWCLAVSAVMLAIGSAVVATWVTGWLHTALQVIAWVNLLVAIAGVLTEVSCEQYPYDDDM